MVLRPSADIPGRDSPSDREHTDWPMHISRELDALLKPLTYISAPGSFVDQFLCIQLSFSKSSRHFLQHISPLALSLALPLPAPTPPYHHDGSLASCLVSQVTSAPCD